MSSVSDPNPVEARELLFLGDASLLKQCEIDVYRASGPGGQKRNKTCSAVRLRHLSTKLIAIAEEDRSQHTNKSRAVIRLRMMVAYRYRLPVCLEGEHIGETIGGYSHKGSSISISMKNTDYPFVVAELLDIIHAVQARISEAASVLGLTTSGIVSFLRRDPKLFAVVNDMRSKQGASSLK